MQILKKGDYYMKKRTLACMLALALGASMLAGCGGGSSGGSSGGSAETKAAETEAAESGEAAETEAAAAPADAADRIQVEFWFAGGKSAVDVVQGVVNDFNNSQDTYYVSTVTQADYTETYQNLQAAIAGKAAPDLVLLDRAPARALYEKQLLASLDDFQAADADYNADDYYEVYASQGTYDDGAVYARAFYGTVQIGYYNIAAFEAAGVDPASIKNWQDMSEAAKKIKDAGYDFGWEPMGGDSKNLIDAAFANGAKVFSDDGQTVTINSPEWVEVWESFRTWIHDDQIMTTHQGGQGWQYWYDTIDDVIQGRAGGYTGSPGDAPDLDFTIVQAMEQPGWNDNPSAPWAQALVLSVLNDSPDDEKAGAYELLKYLTAPEAQAKWSIATGYAPSNKKVTDVAEYQTYLEENQVAGVLLSQSEHASAYPNDPTNGAVLDALNTAASKVEVDGVSAQEALDAAQAEAQAALDDALGK